MAKKSKDPVSTKPNAIQLSPAEHQYMMRTALFIPCETKEHLHRWIKIYLGIDVPNIIVSDDDVQNPSNSCPMDFIWDVYSKTKEGTDAKFTYVLGYAARASMKTLSASILEVLCLFHLNRDVAHLAAIEAQAHESQKDVEGFFNRPILREFLTSKNKRLVEMTRYVRNDLPSDIISPLQYDSLDDVAKLSYDKKSNTIQIIICSMAGTNSFHVPFLCLDELDLAPPGPVEESKMIPDMAPDGGLPMTLMISTRKTAGGPVQKEIDNAASSGLVLKHWNIIDVTRRCEPERHKPEEPMVDIYSSDETLLSYSVEDFGKLSEKEQKKYQILKGYTGCLSCPLFAACKGRLAYKQTSKSPLLKSIDQVIGLFRQISSDAARAQLLCWRPASEGLIYPYYNREVHMLSASEMAARVTGEEYPESFTKKDLIKLFKTLDAQFFTGMDHGYTHNFAAVTAALYGHVLYVIDVISQDKYELQQKVELCKERIGDLSTTVYPDNAYPADNKTFKRHGFKMVDFKKDVFGGIESVRMRINPGVDKLPSVYFLRDDEGCELLGKCLSRYHWKFNAAGDIMDEPQKQDDDELDALRYLCQNVPVNKSRVLSEFTSGNNQLIVPEPMEDPNKDWLKKRIQELTSDSIDDVPSVRGKKGGLNFII